MFCSVSDFSLWPHKSVDFEAAVAAGGRHFLGQGITESYRDESGRKETQPLHGGAGCPLCSVSKLLSSAQGTESGLESET